MPENESFRTLTIANSQHRQEQEGGDVSAGHHHDDNDDDEEEGKEEQGKRVCDEPCSETRRRFKPADEAEPRESNSETLRVPCSLESMVVDQSSDLQASSTRQMDGKAESKEPIGPSDKEMITREAVQNQTENRLQGMDRKNSSGCKTTSAVSVVRTSASDGYNWRKYGQKQVKSPTGSRSYYRCSHSDCCAKKIECRDRLGHVIDIIYKSQHSHESLWKTNSSGEIKFKSSNEPTVETSVPEQPTRVLNDSDSSPSKQPLQEVLSSADKKRQESPGLSENGKVIMKEEHVDEPELKRRVKKEDLTYLDSHLKPGLKSKFVVHAAEHVGISGDGYRWRKYGQKMVKGNPHPRNYYRCTSAGCPVRKQIETAADNPNAVIITYKGVHDHDMPVPKKRHGPPSASLMAAASPASSNNLHLKNTDALQNQKSSPQSSEDTEGELMREDLDLGGEKAIELARTLLSIGFEIKPS